MATSWLWAMAVAGVAAVAGSVPGAAQGADPILAPGAKLEKLATDCAFTEGPAADADGSVYFSDAPQNRIMVYTKDGTAKVWKQGSRGANGMMFDAQGRLVTCNSQLAPDGRTVTRYEKDGRITVLADKYRGKKFNSPNDLAIDRDGRIYFTDPRYGATDDLEQDKMAVYRIEKDGSVTRVIEDVQVPNGILITPDSRTVYVADNNPASGGARTLIAYDVRSDGTLKRRGVIHDFGTGRGVDGMALDQRGNVYATAEEGARSGVYVFSPQGKLVKFIHTPEAATNCTFGDRDLKSLYITAGKSLYRIRTRHAGSLVYPKPRR